MKDDLISRKEVAEKMKNRRDYVGRPSDPDCIIADEPSVPAVPLEPLCELLAEMYHCPGSGWPSSNRACHPECPDEAFEKLCGTDCDNHTDTERWKAFLVHWMEEQNAAD